MIITTCITQSESLPSASKSSLVFMCWSQLTICSLQTFFQGAMQDFCEDQDVDKALKTLGLDNMDQKLGDMTVALMPHQILGVAFMLEKEKDTRYCGGLLCDAMGLGKVSML